MGLPARAQSAPDDPAFEFQWALAEIGAEESWGTGQGRGATVAVLDTGVHLEHEDLAGKLLTGVDFVNNDRVAQDDFGQGTHIAGIVAAVTDNSKGIAGVAPQANVLPVKVLNRRGRGTEEHLLAGIRHAIERKVHVLVMELDADTLLSESGSTFRAAIEESWEAGVVPVVASEHSYVRSQAFSNAPALVVTGVTRQGEAGDYSNGVGQARWGLAAPGGTGDGNENDIFSTFWPHTRRDAIRGNQEFGRYAYDAGNVAAAAHVAGAAAILRGLGQTPQQTVGRLLSSARGKGSTGRDQTYGAGMLHAGAAVKGLPADQREQRRRTTTTTSPDEGAPSPAGGQDNQPPRPEGRTPARTDPSTPSGLQPGTPAAADPPSEPPPSIVENSIPDDITGDLALNDTDPSPGQLPVLPIVALLLLAGSAAITWAMRRRAVDEPLETPLSS